MNILQICPVAFRTREGGFAEHIWNISVRLAKNHSVTLYGSNPGGRYPKFEIVEGVKVYRFKHFSPANAFYFSLELPLNLRKSKFDVVHAHGYQTFPMHISRIAKYRKLVISPHYHASSQSAVRSFLLNLFKPIGQRTLLAANNIICVSDYEQSLICNRFSLGNGNICVIPNGVDFNEYAHLERKPNEFRSILYVGRLEKYKGVQHLIEVLPRLADNVVLDIVGKGPFQGSLEKLAKQEEVLERVNFFQNIPRDKLLQMFVDADVFVLLSKYEAYSIAVAEALCAGTPCVLANVTALSEWIDNRRCLGVDFPIRLDMLAAAIENLMGKRLKPSDIVDLVGTKILDWNSVVTRLENIYVK